MYFFRKIKNKFTKNLPLHDVRAFPQEESLDEKLNLLLKNREMVSFYLFKRNEMRSIYKAEYEDLTIVLYCFEKELKVRLYRGYQEIVEFHYHIAFEKFVYFSPGSFKKLPASDTPLYRFMMFLVTRNWKEMGSTYVPKTKNEEEKDCVYSKDEILIKKEEVETKIRIVLHQEKEYLSPEEMHFLMRMKNELLKEILHTYDGLRSEVQSMVSEEILCRFEKVFQEINAISMKVEGRKQFELEKKLRIVDKMIQ